MSTTSILYFECWRKLGKRSLVPVGVFMAARSKEIMADEAKRFKFDTCEPLTEDQLLARLDPSVGPLNVQHVALLFEKSQNATVAVVEFVSEASETTPTGESAQSSPHQ